jgi:hypothetical protein
LTALRLRFRFILQLVSEEFCFGYLQSSSQPSTSPPRHLPRRLSRRRLTAWPCPKLSRPSARSLVLTTSPQEAPPESPAGLGRPCARQTPRGAASRLGVEMSRAELGSARLAYLTSSKKRLGSARSWLASRLDEPTSLGIKLNLLSIL